MRLCVVSFTSGCGLKTLLVGVVISEWNIGMEFCIAVYVAHDMISEISSATLCSFGIKLDRDGPLDCGVMLGKPCHETIKHWFSSPTQLTVPVKKLRLPHGLFAQKLTVSLYKDARGQNFAPNPNRDLKVTTAQ